MKQIQIYRFALLMLFSLAMCNMAFAQSAPDQWTAESELVTANGVDVELTSNLSKQNDSFTWEQVGYNTNTAMVFNVTATTGNWDVQTHTGQLSYELVDESITAVLTVTGTTDNITSTLTIHGSNGNSDETYTFHIETYTNL